MLQNWPSEERPREKLLRHGAASLSDAELLAIFLRTGVKGCNVVELSRNLLTAFGSIGQLYQADEQSFCQHNVMGSPAVPPEPQKSQPAQSDRPVT